MHDILASLWTQNNTVHIRLFEQMHHIQNPTSFCDKCTRGACASCLSFAENFGKDINYDMYIYSGSQELF